MTENRDTYLPLYTQVERWAKEADRGFIPAYSKSKEGRLIYSYMKKADAIKLGYSVREVRAAGEIFEIGELA